MENSIHQPNAVEEALGDDEVMAEVIRRGAFLDAAMNSKSIFTTLKLFVAEIRRRRRWLRSRG